jgi:predicted ATPase
MPELDTITVKGFKSIRQIDLLKLSPINVVIGPNGSGKSNFIGVFSFLHAIREGRLQEYVIKAGGADKVLHFGAKRTTEIEIGMSFQEDTNQYKLRLGRSSADQLVPLEEVVSYWNKEYPKPYDRILSVRGNEAGISASNLDPIAGYVRGHLHRWRLYHFHDTSSESPLKSTADVGDNRNLRSDGSNLPAYLYLLSQKHAAAFSLIERTIRRVAPFFDGFQLEPLALNPNTIRLEWRHSGSDAFFDSSSLSDGTLRFIALATLFLQPETHRPSVILVDEPELGLHPYAITLLASLIKQASVKTQVVVSTQSSLLLDHFQPEDVLVADRVDGGTSLTRLETEKLASWLADYSLGQLWEKNEIGGRPNGERR